MKENIRLEKGKPCPNCGNLDIIECKKCKKLICLNCSNFVELSHSRGYLCEDCFIEQRNKTIRGS
ncbi:MAG: hypothetical protein ACTSRG_00230 [Candidatus Helarchaeota archaeon]